MVHVITIMKTGLLYPSRNSSTVLTKQLLRRFHNFSGMSAAATAASASGVGCGDRGNNNRSFVVRWYSAGVPTLQKEEGEKDGTTAKGTKEVGFVESTKNQILEKIAPKHVQFYALVAGGTVGAYIVSKGFMSFTGFFTHLSPLVIGKYSFYTGFGTATILGSLALLTADNLYIRADPVFRYTEKWVTNDFRVQQALGSDIYPGTLRSYRLDAGSFLPGKSFQWQPPRIQMIYDVTATTPPFRTGIVTCEAIKKPGIPPRLQTNFLKVDYETGNEHEPGGGTFEGDETIVLKGNLDDMKRVSARSGLSLENLARQVHINRGAAESANNVDATNSTSST